MQADAELGQAFGAFGRIGGPGSRDHQAGGGEYALKVSHFDRFVDRGRGAEVVGGDDETLHYSLLPLWEKEGPVRTVNGRMRGRTGPSNTSFNRGSEPFIDQP